MEEYGTSDISPSSDLPWNFNWDFFHHQENLERMAQFEPEWVI